MVFILNLDVVKLLVVVVLMVLLGVVVLNDCNLMDGTTTFCVGRYDEFETKHMFIFIGMYIIYKYIRLRIINQHSVRMCECANGILLQKT